MADYRDLVAQLNRVLARWDRHSAKCKTCSEWYKLRQTTGPPCEVGSRIVNEIMHLLL